MARRIDTDYVVILSSDDLDEIQEHVTRLRHEGHSVPAVLYEIIA